MSSKDKNNDKTKEEAKVEEPVVADEPKVEEPVVVEEPKIEEPVVVEEKNAGVKSKVAPLPKRSTGSLALVKVRRICTVREGSDAASLVIVEDEFGNGFLMPIDTAFVKGVTSVDTSKLEAAYDWDEEIGEMLPDDWDSLIAQIRRSIWMSGGYRPGKGRVSRRLDHAWPYMIKERK